MLVWVWVWIRIGYPIKSFLSALILQLIGMKTRPIQLNLVERLKLVIIKTKIPLDLRDNYIENLQSRYR